MCFVDLTQAFDRVKLEDVVPILLKREVHPRIITILKKNVLANYFKTEQMLSNVLIKLI